MNSHCERKCNHEENRIKVCAPCGKKIVNKNKSYNSFRVTERIQILINKFLKQDFDVSDPKYPLSVCNTCRNILLDHEKGNVKRQLPIMPNYQDVTLPKETRSNDSCNCYICLTGRYKGHIQVKKGRGHTRQLSNKIDESNGLNGSSSVSQLPNSYKQAPDMTKNNMLLCKTCFQIVGKGINHSCASSSVSVS